MNKEPSRRRLLKQCALSVAVLGGGTVSAQDAPVAGDAARQRLQAMIGGYQNAQMLHVAAKLRIADLLSDGPRSASDLATATGADADSLYRLLRTLASAGVFTELDSSRFQLNDVAVYLQSGAADSLHTAAEVLGAEWMWRPWGALLQTVITGRTAFDELYGMGTFEWFAENPEAGRLFDAGQAQVTASSADAVTRAYNFTTARRIVDVGGGDGTLLAAALRTNPGARGVVFDLEAVVRAAESSYDPNLRARTDFVAGDFFKAVPPDGDVYLMKSILHDWNDADCGRILAVVATAMGTNARLVVAEDLICAPNQPCAAKPRDINMMVRTGGRNRTEQEYRTVLAAGGFRTLRVVPTASTLYLIEAARG